MIWMILIAQQIVKYRQYLPIWIDMFSEIAEIFNDP